MASPPRLLTGVTLLYWGAVTDHSLIGLLCAFAVEARWWVGLRWEAGERGFVRAWHLSFLLMVVAMAWVWLMGESVLGLFDILVWLPLLCLPVMLIQQYSVENAMPLNTFSFVARRKMLIDRREGRPVDPVMVHVGYVYMFVVMISSTLGGRDGKPSDTVSLLAVGVVAVVSLFFSSPVARKRPVAWVVTVLLAAGLSAVGVVGMQRLFEILDPTAASMTGMEMTGEESKTAIGSVGEIKRSNRIYWRVGGESPKPFTLFRTASYNQYHAGVWNHRPERGITKVLDYDSMASRADGLMKIWAFRREDLESRTGMEPGMEIRGEARERTTLPLPDGVVALSDLKVDWVGFNSLGTVLAENPDYGVINFRIALGEGNVIDSDPNHRYDLEGLGEEEDLMLGNLCEELGLEGLTALEIIEVLSQFFRQNFRYTLDLSVGTLHGKERRTALENFLLYNRSGHCEYYATATTLLLRKAGVPARYCQGFSAQERDLEHDEWVLRGRHAHAWCRAYVGGTSRTVVQSNGREKVIWSGGQWVNVDTTPPTWFSLEGSGLSWGQVVLDTIQRWREDFLLWRVQPGNRLTVNSVMTMLGSLLLVWIILRVWRLRVRKRKREIAGGRDRADVPMTSLHTLERVAEPWLGVRPAGVALTRWLGGLGPLIPAPAAEDLKVAVVLHWKARFDPLGAEDGERERLEHLCGELRKILKEMPGSSAVRR